jgi:hypothetical protein
LTAWLAAGAALLTLADFACGFGAAAVRDAPDFGQRHAPAGVGVWWALMALLLFSPHGPMPSRSGSRASRQSLGAGGAHEGLAHQAVVSALVIPQELTDFCDQNSLRHIYLARLLIARRISF